jgi:hypothetical protein
LPEKSLGVGVTAGLAVVEAASSNRESMRSKSVLPSVGCCDCCAERGPRDAADRDLDAVFDAPR